MKFGQLIKYNMKNIFLETSYTKCDREATPRPSSKKTKLRISMDQYCKVCQAEDYQKWLKLSCRPFGFTSYKGFLKNKKRSKNSLRLIFCMIFEEKYFCYTLLPDQISMSGCLYFIRYWTISVL